MNATHSILNSPYLFWWLLLIIQFTLGLILYLVYIFRSMQRD